MRRRRNRGVALITAMLVAALATMVAGFFQLLLMKKLQPLNGQRQCFLKLLINLCMGFIKFFRRHLKLA